MEDESSVFVKDNVIREGEKQGHKHELMGGQATLSLFDDQEEGTIKVDKATTMVHPEHDPIKLPKGDYVVKIQKEATGKHTHQSVKD